MSGQYLGAFLASLILWGEYADLITMVSNYYISCYLTSLLIFIQVELNKTNTTSYSSVTQGIFASYPFFQLKQVTTLSLAMDQMLGTAMLLIIILAVTDKENMKMESSMVPISIGLGLTAIHLRYGIVVIGPAATLSLSSFGLTAGAAINPARDFAPRLLTLIAGWDQPFKVGHQITVFKHPVISLKRS